MPAGVRYGAELHVRLNGRQGTASLYLPHARKLMGDVLADAQHHGLAVHSRRIQLDDGAVILAEKIAAINRVTITPPPEPDAPDRLRPPDDLVVWARDQANPEGIDAEHPQQILRGRKQGDAMDWRTFFYSESVAGHEAFAGPKGTYVVLFPEGLRHAGNIDWRSERGEVISWYGPTGRYWPDAYVQPRAQYGKGVYMLGQALLDVDQYELDSPEQAHGPDRYITGAALKRTTDGLWLYTVQSEAKDASTPPPPQYIDSLPSVGCPFTREDNEGGIYRYRLLRFSDPAGVARYRVVPSSRERMLELNGNHAEPWFFNQSCSQGHSYALPLEGWFSRIKGSEHPEVPAMPVLPVSVPDPIQTFLDLSIDELGICSVATVELTVPFDGTPVHFAADYKGDERVFAYVSDLADVYFEGFEVGNGGYPAGPVGFDVAGKSWKGLISERGLPFFPNPHGWLTAHLVFADLRQDLLVLDVTYQWEIDYILGTKRDQAIEVFRAGVRVYTTRTLEDRPYSPAEMCGYGQIYYAATGHTTATALAPYFYLFGVAVSPVRQTGSLYRTTTFAGFAGGMSWNPYPANAHFNYTAGYLVYDWSAPMERMRSIVPGGFHGNREDFDAHYAPFAAVATDELLAISGYLPANADPYATNVSFIGSRSCFHVEGGDLPDLTGVRGANARYHPLWLLGKPPMDEA